MIIWFFLLDLGWGNHGLAPSMNPAFHEGGLTAWDVPGDFLATLTPTQPLSDLPAGWLPQSLSWSQLVGVSAIVDRLFSSTVGPSPQGVLLADEVGLGKTAHSIALIAFLNQIIDGRGSTPPLSDPPIIREILIFTPFSYSCFAYANPPLDCALYRRETPSGRLPYHSASTTLNHSAQRSSTSMAIRTPPVAAERIRRHLLIPWRSRQPRSLLCQRWPIPIFSTLQVR